MKLHLMYQHGTYKTFSERICIKKSGKCPFKLLFDKSLKETKKKKIEGKEIILMQSYNFESQKSSIGFKI
jgi:hypothetical protein